MHTWRKWGAGRRARSERARKAANARWDAVRAGRMDEPVRETRVVEMTIRDTHRPQRTIRMKAEEARRGWGRWHVWENGVRIGTRRIGRTMLAEAIARSLM